MPVSKIFPICTIFFFLQKNSCFLYNLSLDHSFCISQLHNLVLRRYFDGNEKKRRSQWSKHYRQQRWLSIRNQPQIICCEGLMMGMGKREGHDGTNSIGNRGRYWIRKIVNKLFDEKLWKKHNLPPRSFDGHGEEGKWFKQSVNWKQRYKLQPTSLKLR